MLEEGGSFWAQREDVAKVLEAIGFLAGSLVTGRWVSPRMFHIASQLNVRMVLLAFGLAFCFLLSWLADFIGLAPGSASRARRSSTRACSRPWW